jgi:hypothetical protein
LTLIVGLPIVATFVLSFTGPLLGSRFQDLDWAARAILIYAGGFLLCTNPFATVVATKLLEDEQNTLFLFTVPLSSAQGTVKNIPLVSPWIVYVLFYTLLSALLIAASIVILNRKRG